MKIALDYDGTYTADPELWDDFIDAAMNRGHEVAIVTKRPNRAGAPTRRDIPKIFTNRMAKAAYYAADVWIDDDQASSLRNDGCEPELDEFKSWVAKRQPGLIALWENRK
jgi:hypothetical protein